MRIEQNGCSCDVDDFQGGLILTALYTEPEHRGKGAAREVLSIAKQVARVVRKPLYLFVAPFNDQPLGIPTLRAFYESVGFELDEEKTTVYTPWMRIGVPDETDV